jgi:hypothetical protein
MRSHIFIPERKLHVHALASFQAGKPKHEFSPKAIWWSSDLAGYSPGILIVPWLTKKLPHTKNPNGIERCDDQVIETTAESLLYLDHPICKRGLLCAPGSTKAGCGRERGFDPSGCKNEKGWGYYKIQSEPLCQACVSCTRYVPFQAFMPHPGPIMTQRQVSWDTKLATLFVSESGLPCCVYGFGFGSGVGRATLI